MNYHPFDFNKSMSKDGHAHFTYVGTLLVAAVMCMSIAECVYMYACMYVYVYIACVRACVCVCVYLHVLCVYIKVDRDAYHCQSIRTCSPCQISTITFYPAPHILYRDRFHDPLTAPNSFEQFELNFGDIIDFQNIDVYLQNIYNIGFTLSLHNFG